MSVEYKEWIYRPWAYSVIIKLATKKVSHEYLRKRLINIWKPTKDLVLIDLGFDYYTVKFLKEDNMHTALQKGPWFINGFFLSVKIWNPNLVASEARNTIQLYGLDYRNSQLNTMTTKSFWKLVVKLESLLRLISAPLLHCETDTLEFMLRFSLGYQWKPMSL